ncbi:MAG TPA: hypothetical protein VFW80_05005 [Gaiellaceae bacterium]|nr:hypothetical protein [Gaiellaceae bacterium]
MATQTVDRRAAARDRASGWYGFAGVLFLIVGAMNILQGLIALLKDDYFAVTKAGLLFADFSAWGSFFLALGIIEVFVGLGILSARTWARVVGVLLLMVNTVVQFAFIAAFPIWTLAAIALNITIISALMRPLDDYERPRYLD